MGALRKLVVTGVIVAGIALAVPRASADRTPDPTPRAQVHANQVSEDILALVSGQPGFGGLWVDRAGITHVGVTTAEAGRFKSMLDPRFAGEFVLERRATTYPELVKRRDRVTEMMPKLRAAGLDLLEWGPDEKAGTLWVSLKQYTPEKAAKLREILGEDVKVEPAMATGGPGDMLSARLQ